MLQDRGRMNDIEASISERQAQTVCASESQLVFGQVFHILGYPETIGIIAASAVQIFCSAP